MNIDTCIIPIYRILLLFCMQWKFITIEICTVRAQWQSKCRDGGDVNVRKAVRVLLINSGAAERQSELLRSSEYTDTIKINECWGPTIRRTYFRWRFFTSKV